MWRESWACVLQGQFTNDKDKDGKFKPVHVLDVPVVHRIAVRYIAFRIKPARLNLGIVY